MNKCEAYLAAKAEVTNNSVRIQMTDRLYQRCNPSVCGTELRRGRAEGPWSMQSTTTESFKPVSKDAYLVHGTVPS